jgi:hypothetical protein
MLGHRRPKTERGSQNKMFSMVCNPWIGSSLPLLTAAWVKSSRRGLGDAEFYALCSSGSFIGWLFVVPRRPFTEPTYSGRTHIP